MKIKSIVLFLTCLLLLSSFTTPATACCEGDPPGECYVCEDTVWVQYGDCWGGCPECESCVSCYCECTSDCCEDEDCSGECESCDSCSCVDDESKCPGECDTCDDGTCTDHDYKCSWRFCETCIDGECEDRCPALGKHCDSDTGSCEECVDVLHCELCEECIYHECVHPCDDCDPPKYCGYACACVECYYGEEDTTTCSVENSTTKCNCSDNISNPCSSEKESVVYSGASLKSCTGPDCGSINVLCYTTYQECMTSGSIKPLQWCMGAGFGGTIVCDVVLGLPGPGCYTCVHSFESGVPTYESQGDCAIEQWPE